MLGEDGDPAPKAEGATQSPRRRRLLRTVEVVLALSLLAFVAWNLPWRDTLVHAPSEDVEVSVHGRLFGDWKSDHAAFRIAPEAEPDPAWPDAWRAAHAEGRVLELGPGDTGMSWRPGLPRVFLDVRPAGLALALMLLVTGVFLGVTRWWRLLGLAGCGTTWLATARLTYLGLFFNLVLPGLTGGDLVKAGMAVRDHPHARADALVSVVVDRVIGLWALLGLAAGVLLFVEQDALAALRLPVALAFLGATAVLVIALHPASRRLVGLEHWIDKLPQARRLRKMDHAARIYGGHPLVLTAAFGLSLANHLCTAGALWALGGAFGAALDFASYLAIGSVANTITAVPLAPGGWGLGEAAYATLFELVGSSATLGVAVSVSYRLLMHAIGFGGGIALLLPGGRGARRTEREAELTLDRTL